MGFFTGSDPRLETFSTVSSEQGNVIGDLSGMFRALLAGLPGGLAPGFPDLQAAVPGLSNLQNLSLAGLESLALGQSSGTRAGQAVDAGRQQIADIFSQGPADFEEFFKTNIEDPAFETFRERIAPSIRREGVRRGGIFGSSVEKDLQQGSEDLIDSLTRERGNLAFQTELANRENVIRAIQLIPGLEAIDPQILALMLEAGGVQQMPAQQQFQALLQMLDEVSRRLGQASSFATAGTQGAGTIPGQQGFLGGLADAFGQGLSQTDLSGIFSGSAPTNTATGAPFGRTTFIPGFEPFNFPPIDFEDIFGGGQESCWVAAEYFGWYTPRWWAARRYILASSVAGVYKKYGKTLATRVRNEPALKAQLRPFFEGAADNG